METDATPPHPTLPEVARLAGRGQCGTTGLAQGLPAVGKILASTPGSVEEPPECGAHLWRAGPGGALALSPRAQGAFPLPPPRAEFRAPTASSRSQGRGFLCWSNGGRNRSAAEAKNSEATLKATVDGEGRLATPPQPRTSWWISSTQTFPDGAVPRGDRTPWGCRDAHPNCETSWTSTPDGLWRGRPFFL